MPHVLVRGAGVGGLAVAHELVRRGARVTLCDTGAGVGRGASFYAGGMLAPYCEREGAPPEVQLRGRTALDWWQAAVPGLVWANGTLVVAPARDGSEVARFAARTEGWTRLDAEAIGALEPGLAGRFRDGLHFVAEGHLDPRAAMAALAESLARAGAEIRLGAQAHAAGGARGSWDAVVDCTGIARLGQDGRLRGVRGEMLVLRAPDVDLARPVRLLHPRIPVYVVPRGQGVFMLGATMIETDGIGPITVRSAMELLNAAYTLHPAFGEAEIVEMGAGVRPAYRDNLPRVERAGSEIVVNGFYRHGFLLAPWAAREVARLVLGAPATEADHETDRQRSYA